VVSAAIIIAAAVSNSAGCQSGLKKFSEGSGVVFRCST